MRVSPAPDGEKAHRGAVTKGLLRRLRSIRRVDGLHPGLCVFRVDLDDHGLGRMPVLPGDVPGRGAARRDLRERRRRRALAVALRIVLRALGGPALAGTKVTRTRAGKPALVGSRLAFSLAHCGSRGVIAVGRGQIGVDLELPRRVQIPAARRAQVLAAGAAFGSDAGPADLRFIRAWTRLEAVAKATGQGIGATLDAFEVRAHAAAADASALRRQARGLGLAVHDLRLSGDLVGAIAAGRHRSMGRRPR